MSTNEYWHHLHGNFDPMPLDILRAVQMHDLSLDLLKKSEEMSRQFRRAVELAIRANVGRAKTLVERELHDLDKSTEVHDAAGAALAVVSVEWDGAVARVFLHQIAEPSFIFA